MLAGALMIVAGLAAVVWTRWLVPHQMDRVRRCADADWQARYDDTKANVVVKRAETALVMFGVALAIIGVIFTLTEL